MIKGRMCARSEMTFGSEGDRSRFARAITLEIGHDRVTVAFVALEVDIGNLDKATEMTTDKDIASDGN